MTTMLKSPARYVQGNGVLGEIDRYVKGLGSRFLIITSASGRNRVGKTMESCFEGKEYAAIFTISGGHCTMEEIKKMRDIALAEGCTAIIGVGGGSILDTAKAAAELGGMDCVMVPTVASNDSPCSACSVVYKHTGEFERCIFLNDCPRAIVVDTGVILKSPVRFLVAGMGDAMATYFEARSCKASGHNNQLRAKPTITATEMAALCWNYLKMYGAAAKRDAENGVDSEYFETIVEVNTYLSSVGFESGGLAAAHAVQIGLTTIQRMKAAQHGELVAFCTLVQLVMEKAGGKELEEVLDFCLAVGLPVCFEDLGYPQIDKNELLEAAHVSCAPKSTIHNMPAPVAAADVYEAMLQTDSLGCAYKEAQGRHNR